jgi:CDGSH-type Zn-finger protein
MRRRVPHEGQVLRIVTGGPILVAGPVEVEYDGGAVYSDRFVVAICACRRSGIYPLCDTSHRRRRRPARDAE